MGLRISNDEAKNEAKRIASEFVASQLSAENQWEWECWEPTPDVISSNYKVRKTVVKWCVAVQWMKKGGGVLDGNSVICVDILTKEARFS